jgi:hypothetical protein
MALDHQDMELKNPSMVLDQLDMMLEPLDMAQQQHTGVVDSLMIHSNWHFLQHSLVADFEVHLQAYH